MAPNIQILHNFICLIKIHPFFSWHLPFFALHFLQKLKKKLKNRTLKNLHSQLNMASSSVDFQWPTQYSFPPFFTIQPNAETRKKQLEIWSKLIRRYCKTKKMFVLEKSNNNISLFNNTRISRQLSIQSIEAVLDDMNSRGEIEWLDSSVKDRCFVFWHTPSEWGKLVYTFAQENGLARSVATLFEISNAEDQEFSGMDTAMLIRCLQTLQSEGKAEVMGEDGVKFF